MKRALTCFALVEFVLIALVITFAFLKCGNWAYYTLLGIVPLTFLLGGWLLLIIRREK
ncbi:MAG: hypothetical protein RSD41_04335 [Kiritimatiellia bacterium]